MKNKKELICEELVKTSNYIMKSGWSNNLLKYGYHSFDIDDISILGQRNSKCRVEEFSKYFNFKGKNILDLGCNVGGMLFHIPESNQAIGIDYDSIVINAAKNISKILEMDNMKFIQFNFDTDDYNLLENQIDSPIDIVFLLSMGVWVKERWKLYDFALSYNCPIILETNNEKVNHIELQYFQKQGYTAQLIIDGSLDDITGNKRRKTYLVTQ